MRAVIVYESIYGNTHVIADAIGRGLTTASDVDVLVVPSGQAKAALIDAADLLVVGGPTHARGLSRESTRAAARADAAGPDDDMVLDPDAEGSGLRDWFEAIGHLGVPAAAFDTRVHASATVSGRASRGIERRLRQHGCRLVAAPASFFVDPANRLEPGEEERATRWGRSLGTQLDRSRRDRRRETAARPSG